MSTFERYREALTDVGPKLAELTLEAAANDPHISLSELARLAEFRRCWEGGV